MPRTARGQKTMPLILMRRKEPMNRIAQVILHRFPHVPSFLFQLFRYGTAPDRYTAEEKYAFSKRISRHFEAGGNVRIQVFGRQNIPAENGFVFFPNHQGLFDAYALAAACDRPFHPVVKKELMEIPVGNLLFRCAGALSMDRGDLKQSMKVIREVGDRVANGENWMIFPEGTRSRAGNRLLDFKGGSFRCAVRPRRPVVPVALIDSYKVLDSGFHGPVTVQVHILKPICYEEYRHWNTVELAQRVHDRIQQVILAHTPAPAAT